MTTHGAVGAQLDDGIADLPDFRVLLVCTANLCRSPMAQFLLDSALSSIWTGRGRWAVTSAGVIAHDGRPMHRRAAQALEEIDLDGSQFRTQRLRLPLVQSADLILTATREHRAEVARMQPVALKRLFTINQFAYLLAHAAAVPQAPSAGEAGRALIEAAIAVRGQVASRTSEDDLADPVNRPMRAFRDCRQKLATDFAEVGRLLRRPSGQA